MNTNDPIMNEVRTQVKQLALSKECLSCQTVGNWRMDQITEGINLISKTRTTRAKRDCDNPVFLVFTSCLHCGHLQKETIEPQRLLN